MSYISMIKTHFLNCVIFIILVIQFSMIPNYNSLSIHSISTSFQTTSAAPFAFSFSYETFSLISMVIITPFVMLALLKCFWFAVSNIIIQRLVSLLQLSSILCADQYEPFQHWKTNSISNLFKSYFTTKASCLIHLIMWRYNS